MCCPLFLGSVSSACGLLSRLVAAYSSTTGNWWAKAMPARKPRWQLRSHWSEIGWSMQDGCHTTSTFAHKSWKSNIPTVFLLGGTTSGLYHPMCVGMFHLERLPPYPLACFPHKCVHYSLSQLLGNPSSTSRYVGNVATVLFRKGP